MNEFSLAPRAAWNPSNETVNRGREGTVEIDGTQPPDMADYADFVASVIDRDEGLFAYEFGIETIIRHCGLLRFGIEIEVSIPLLAAGGCLPERWRLMTTMNYAFGAADVMLLNSTVEIELEPVYGEVPAIRPQRSAEEKRCAAMMLDKLRRRDDVMMRLPAACDGDCAIDVIVEKLIDRLEQI